MALTFVRRRWRWIRFPRWDIQRDGVKVGRIRYYGGAAEHPGFRVSIDGRNYPRCVTLAQAKLSAEKAGGRSSRKAAPPRPVVPPWCMPGALEARTDMLLAALIAAGSTGLHRYNDINPLDMSEAATNRGVEALVLLEMRGLAVENDDDERVRATEAALAISAPEMPR
jgi:hypothetical protein